MNYFSGDDLIFYKDSNTNKIISGGYSIDSILLKEGKSPMMTLNKTGGSGSGSGTESGTESVSNIFENLAVPAGLFYQNGSGLNNNNNIEINYKSTESLPEDIHDKLFKMVEVYNTKKKPKTYKLKNKNTNKLSRKNITN
jgi:hypothetical protein